MSGGRRVAENVIGAGYQVAVLVPCYNEKHAVAKAVADLRAALSEAAIHVCDNDSNRPHRRGRAPRAPGEERRRT
jgi:hypothetical protein